MVSKKTSRNALIVAQGNDHPALFRQSLIASNATWIAGRKPNLPFSCTAKIRYRQDDQACRIEEIDSMLRVDFKSPQRAVTPGQSVVFYDGDICLGGGVIEDFQ